VDENSGCGKRGEQERHIISVQDVSLLHIGFNLFINQIYSMRGVDA